MTWLTWRQFRGQAVAAVVALAVFAILLAATGPHLASLYAASGISGCHSGACGQLANNFLLGPAGRYVLVYVLGIGIIVLAPAVIGIFWGAPLIARELETGTFQLAWTQSITRTRWLAVKLALTGLVAMAVTEALSLMYGWWAAPIGQAARLDTPPSPVPFGMSPLAFEVHGITPLGYAAFAFTLAVTVGVVLRRSVPAMAVTLAIFAAVQIAVPHLVPPDRTVAAVGMAAKPDVLARPGSSASSGLPVVSGIVARAVPDHPGAWIASSGLVNAAGQAVSTLPATCSPSQGPHQFGSCLASRGIRLAISYQPASRYWPLQWTETTIFAALALALAGYCFWRLRRRLM
jgi:hypothetical protein